VYHGAAAGDHEEMLLAALEGRSDLRYWLRFGGTEALASYGKPRTPAQFAPGAQVRVKPGTTQIGKRVVVIAGPMPANKNEKAGCRGTAGKAVRVRRTVVIRNGRHG
jgi:hypothetical protein